MTQISIQSKMKKVSKKKDQVTWIRNIEKKSIIFWDKVDLCINNVKLSFFKPLSKNKNKFEQIQSIYFGQITSMRQEDSFETKYYIILETAQKKHKLKISDDAQRDQCIKAILKAQREFLMKRSIADCRNKQRFEPKENKTCRIWSFCS